MRTMVACLCHLLTREIWTHIRRAGTWHINTTSMVAACQVEAVIVFILSPFLSLLKGLY